MLLLPPYYKWENPSSIGLRNLFKVGQVFDDMTWTPNVLIPVGESTNEFYT